MYQTYLEHLPSSLGTKRAVMPSSLGATIVVLVLVVHKVYVIKNTHQYSYKKRRTHTRSRAPFVIDSSLLGATVMVAVPGPSGHTRSLVLNRYQYSIEKKREKSTKGLRCIHVSESILSLSLGVMGSAFTSHGEMVPILERRIEKKETYE